MKYRFQVAGNIWSDISQGGDGTFHDLPNQLHATFLPKGGLQGGQFVERDSQAVDLANRIAGPFKLLGGHVTQGSHHVSGLGQVVVLGCLGQSKIGNPDIVFLVKQQVGRFDITVQDAVSVRVMDRISDLNANVGDLNPAQL